MASGKNDVTTALLSKSLDDGNNLYKATDFPNASKVYERALKHVGELSPQTPPVNQTIPLKMADICAHLLLGYSRCQRKLGDLPLATHSATRALALKPNWYEALYARARVLRESQHLTEALNDVLSAERSAPDHNLKDIRRLIERIKDEIRKGEYRPSRPGSASSDIASGGPRRHRSKSNSNNQWQGSHSSAEISSTSSYQPPPSSSSSHKLQSLSGGLPGGLSTRSDNLNESMVSLSSSYHQPPASEFLNRNPPQRSNSGYWHGGAGTPRPRLNRSLSTDERRPRPTPHHRRDFSDDVMSAAALDNDHMAAAPYYYRNDTPRGDASSSTKNCRVTDL